MISATPMPPAGGPGFDVAASTISASSPVGLRRLARARRGRGVVLLSTASRSWRVRTRRRVTMPGAEDRRRALALHDPRARLLLRVGLAPLALEREAVLLRARRVGIDEDSVFLCGGRASQQQRCERRHHCHAKEAHAASMPFRCRGKGQLSANALAGSRASASSDGSRGLSARARRYRRPASPRLPVRTARSPSSAHVT